MYNIGRRMDLGFILFFVCLWRSSSGSARYEGDIGVKLEAPCPGGPYSSPDNVKFQRNGRIMSETANLKINGSVLIFLKPEVRDNGPYFCIVTRPGKPLSRYFFVVSIRKPGVLLMEPIKTTTSITVGDHFAFKCTYDRANKQINWSVTRGHGNSSFVSIPRLKIKVVQSTPTVIETYVIEAAQHSDTGTYHCEVDNARVNEQDRVLTVLAKTKPGFGLSPNKIINKTEGESLQVFIDPSGQPFPNISCLKDGREILFCPSRSTQACESDGYRLNEYFHAFVVDNLSFSKNHGKFTCVATNVVGSAKCTFRVSILVPPEINKNVNTFYQEENKVGRVVCDVTRSNPNPRVVWYTQTFKDLQTGPDDNRWIISNLETTLDVSNQRYRNILTIPANLPQAFFLCNATNEMGTDKNIYRFLRYVKNNKPIKLSREGVVIINEGDSLTLTCSVTVSIGGEINLHRQDSATNIVNSTTSVTSFTKDATYRHLTVKFYNMTVNDSGVYECLAKEYRDESAAVALTVKAIHPAVVVGLENKKAAYGDVSVVLFCNVTGNPAPIVEWKKDGELIKLAKLGGRDCKRTENGYYNYDGMNLRLFICKPESRNVGLYTCSARNKLGKSSRSAFVDVTEAALITNLDNYRKVTLRVGKQYSQPCKATGNPTPMVQWVKDGKPVSNESFAESVLAIADIEKSSFGNYTCMANNIYGSDNKTLEIELLVEPTPLATSSKSLSTGTIIGIVLGIIVLLTVIVLVILFWWRKQQKKLLFYKHQYFLKTGEYMVDPSRTLNEQSLNLTYDPDWEFPFERLVVGERLGAGAFGEVYKAEAMGILGLQPREKSQAANKRRSKLRRSLRASQRPKKRALSPDITNATVAVKTLKGSATESEIRDLAAELKIMIHLGEHKNIVNLLGACTKGRRMYVILEFCPYGNMLGFLRTKREMYQSTWVKEVFDPEKEFTLIDLVGAAFQVAKGMEFLAGRKLIHRDLAARNILVGDEYVMKISDFGLARDIYQDDVYVKKSSGLLPVKWMAMESLFERVYTHQSDVWSFGVLLWEMMTLGGTPYPGLPAEQLLDYLSKDKRMPQPLNCPLEIYTIMRDCWNKEPEQRPTFSTLVDHLGRILERHLSKESPYLQVEASQEELDAAREKELLINPKSDYYLEPLLLAAKQQYDANAPLPTPPCVATPTDETKIDIGKKPDLSENADSGSYTRLREDGDGDACKNGIPFDDIRKPSDDNNSKDRSETVV